MAAAPISRSVPLYAAEGAQEVQRGFVSLHSTLSWSGFQQLMASRAKTSASAKHMYQCTFIIRRGSEPDGKPVPPERIDINSSTVFSELLTKLHDTDFPYILVGPRSLQQAQETAPKAMEPSTPPQPPAQEAHPLKAQVHSTPPPRTAWMGDIPRRLFATKSLLQHTEVLLQDFWGSCPQDVQVNFQAPSPYGPVGAPIGAL